MNAAQRAASLEALRLGGDYNTDIAVWGNEHQASLAALFTSALSGTHELLPTRIAEGALGQLACELTILAEAMGKEFNPDILTAMIHGMADRARVAAELSSRINAANPSGFPDAREESEAAE